MTQADPTSPAAKRFPLSAVLGVTTGIVVRDFGEIHEVFDHLYPGIMTIGVAAMSGHAKAEILKQHPALADATWPGVPESAAWLAALEAQHGATLSVETIDQPDGATISQAFADFHAGVTP